MGARLAISCAALLAAAVPSTSFAARQISTGTGDLLYESSSASERDLWFQRSVDAGAGYARINVHWSAIAPTKPLLAGNPGDPAYRWGPIDAAVGSADAHGLRVLFTLYGAPPWAHPSDVPPGIRPEAWKPSPSDFGRFAHAVAERYSTATAQQPLPPERWYEIWNEPNLSAYIAPQFNGKMPASPIRYAELLNAAYAQIKSVAPGAQVISAGTGAYGTPNGGSKMHPITFLRSLFCVQGVKPCAPRPHMDVLAHHPIDRKYPPTHSAPNPLDVTTPDLGRIRKVVAAAERAGNLVAPKPLPLWVSEFWWETNPPDRNLGVSPKRQAEYIEQALYMYWRQKVPVAINLQIRDSQTLPGNPLATYQTGLYYFDGTRKPSYTAFRFPFVTDRRSAHSIDVWGKSPATGELLIQRRDGGRWHRLKTIHANAGRVFASRLHLRGGARLRAKVGGETSLPWHQRR